MCLIRTKSDYAQKLECRFVHNTLDLKCGPCYLLREQKEELMETMSPSSHLPAPVGFDLTPRETARKHITRFMRRNDPHSRCSEPLCKRMSDLCASRKSVKVVDSHSLKMAAVQIADQRLEPRSLQRGPGHHIPEYVHDFVPLLCRPQFHTAFLKRQCRLILIGDPQIYSYLHTASLSFCWDDSNRSANFHFTSMWRLLKTMTRSMAAYILLLNASSSMSEADRYPSISRLASSFRAKSSRYSC